MIDDATYLELLNFLEDELTTAEQATVVEKLCKSRLLAAELLRIAQDEARLIEWARSVKEDAAVELAAPPLARAAWPPRTKGVHLAVAAMLLMMLGAAYF